MILGSSKHVTTIPWLFSTFLLYQLKLVMCQVAISLAKAIGVDI